MGLRRFLDLDQDLDQDLMNLNSSASATNQKFALLEWGGAVYSVQNLAPPDWVRPRRPMLESFAGCLKEL